MTLFYGGSEKLNAFQHQTSKWLEHMEQSLSHVLVVDYQ